MLPSTHMRGRTIQETLIRVHIRTHGNGVAGRRSNGVAVQGYATPVASRFFGAFRRLSRQQ